MFLLALCLGLFLIKAFWFFSDTESDKIYKQGVEFFNKGDYQNAYYNFKKISILSSYSIPALYRQATCAWELNDSKTAIKKYSKFAKIYKNTEAAPEAIWKVALLEENKGDRRKANSYYNKIINKYPESDFAKASAYKLGVYYFDNNEKHKAKDFLVEYIEYAPMGRYSLDVLSMLQSYKTMELSLDDKFFMAESYFQNGKYMTSLEILSEIPLADSWLLMAKNYDKLERIEDFQNAVLKGVSIQQKKRYDEKAILEIMSLYIKKSYLPQKQAAYNLVVNTKENSLYSLSLFLYSKYVDYDSSIKNYEKIYTVYPNSIVAPDSLWLVFWDRYKKGEYEEALKLSKFYTNVYFDYNIQPKIMFWTAKIHIKNGHKKHARAVLHNIVSNFPNSYYAFRSFCILKHVKSPWNPKTNVRIKDKFTLENFPLDYDKKEYRLLHKFSALGDWAVISNFKINDKFLDSWLSAMSGKKAYSVRVARDEILENQKIPFSNPGYKLAYPLYYKDEVNLYSEKYNVNPYLMISLIREESFFNAEAVSSTGARGLMQLMPSTALLMDPSGGNLFRGEYNISLGVKYFAHLMEIFNGNAPLCVLAYNSGPGSVKKWLNNSNGGDFDEFVENVPYPETANYIKKVYASYWVYMNIYERM